MNNRRLLVTGGSGFIGSNVVHYYRNIGWDVINISQSQPLSNQHRDCWKKCSITDYERLKEIIIGFSPDFIIHLAGRTDETGKDLKDYQVNIDGVKNLLDIAKCCSTLKKIVFLSSIMANVDGQTKSMYGLSKAEGEKIIIAEPPMCDWAIIRPVAIWGPGFKGTLYSFFERVCRGTFFKLDKIAGKKSFGYVDNIVYQIDRILNTDTRGYSDKVFYIGDYESYTVNDWADEIASVVGRKIYTIPYWMAKSTAIVGDVLNFCGIVFPLTSKRINNLRLSNMVDLEKTKALAPNLPFTRLDGVRNTIEWMNCSKAE